MSYYDYGLEATCEPVSFDPPMDGPPPRWFDTTGDTGGPTSLAPWTPPVSRTSS